MMTGYYLVGYDRHTDIAVEYHALPPNTVAAAMHAAELSAEVAALGGDWPLSSQAACQIAALTGATIDVGNRIYCLEPFAPLAKTVSPSRAAE